MPEVSLKTHREIRNVIRYVCEVNDTPELINVIAFKFNNRLTSTWAKAHQQDKIIEISQLNMGRNIDTNHKVEVRQGAIKLEPRE